MTRPLQILLVEDDANDALLLTDELTEAGFEFEYERVQTEFSLRIALTARPWDIVFSDYSMPRFNGLDAFKIFQEAGLDIPFIMVSGTLGEETAVEAMRRGVDDYILKDRRDGLARSVERAFRERERRREDAHARAEAEGRLAAVLEQLPAMVWTTDLDLQVTWLGGSGLTAAGVGPEEVSGLTVGQLWPGDATTSAPEAQHRSALEGCAGSYEVTWHGRIFQAHVRALHRTDGALMGALGVALDVTDNRKLARQFQVAQRMESVGQLAGGVAHDFNNILGVVLGAAELIRDETPPESSILGEIQQIELAAHRGASLSRQLLAYGRRQLFRPELLDLDRLLQGLREMLVRMLGEGFELLFTSEADLWRVEFDPGQVEQVVMNLVLNARDAMVEGGKIWIETRNVTHDEAYVAAHAGAKAGRYVEIAVTDTGHGMDRSTQDRIFEPFFTTKAKDKGTGLGLASVYGIIKQGGGEIRVHSELNCGTTFRVHLAAADASCVELPPAPILTPSLDCSGSEKILICEDNEELRSIARVALERKGYRVLEAASALDALEVMDVESNDIDLLVSDVFLPGMTGPELVVQLRESLPSLKVIFTSGYTEAAVFPAKSLSARDAFMPKPVRLKELVAMVRSMLDATAEVSEAGK